MKLYIRPRAGSLAPHIALYEASAKFEVDVVDTATKETSDGRDYLALNKMGYVPTLELGNGALITEGPAILCFIADSFPAKRLSPRTGTVARAQMNSYLNFIAAEIHKSFSPFFASPALSLESREAAQAVLDRKIDFINGEFSDGRDYLMGDDLTVSDAYLFTVLRWLPATDKIIGNWPHLESFLDRMKSRPAVRAAMIAEDIEDELNELAG